MRALEGPDATRPLTPLEEILSIIGSGQATWSGTITPVLMEGASHSPLDALDALSTPEPIAHPYVWAYCTYQYRRGEVIRATLDLAAEENAPADATRRRGDGTWATLADIRNPRTRRFMTRWAAERGLPEPTWTD